MTVNWSDHAIDRLRCHIRYIAENSDLETASRWHARLNETTGLLASFPTVYPRTPTHLSKPPLSIPPTLSTRTRWRSRCSTLRDGS